MYYRQRHVAERDPEDETEQSMTVPTAFVYLQHPSARPQTTDGLTAMVDCRTAGSDRVVFLAAVCNLELCDRDTRRLLIRFPDDSGDMGITCDKLTGDEPMEVWLTIAVMRERDSNLLCVCRTTR